jgi:peptide-methionine (S)-S-oxide reductase|tara:strand:+ start:1828 stop:2277 length:450 start_codon:yes stop_codon:yes gene_type:complete
MQKCYLALGCFWKPEETFRSIKGITETEVGYAGGKNKNVTYEEICTGNTEHAETVKITFDENLISFEKILEYFFNIHDPTQKDMQYPDVGTQYRSEIFYQNEVQKETAEKFKKLFSQKISGSIETKISELKNYCKAEEYHQKYIMKRGR